MEIGEKAQRTGGAAAEVDAAAAFGGVVAAAFEGPMSSIGLVVSCVTELLRAAGKNEVIKMKEQFYKTKF